MREKITFFKKNWGTLFAFLIYIATYILDRSTPFGVIVWILYFLPILLNFPIPTSLLFLFPTIATIFTFSLTFEPEHFPLSFSLFNRSLIMFILWLAAIMLNERRKAEKEILVKQSDLEKAQSAAHLGSWRWDLKNQKVYWSKELYKIFQVDEKSFVPSTDIIAKMIHSDDRKKYTKVLRNILKNKEFTPFELRIIRPDGEIRVGLCNGFDIEYDENKKLKFLFGTILDITERKKAEEALRISEDKFSSAFASNPAGLTLTRFEDGLFIDVNDTWLKLNGYTREEIIGFSARKMKIWPNEQDIKRFVYELKDKGFLKNMEQKFLKKNGEEYFVQMSSQILKIRGQKLILTTFIDITERKSIENALKVSEKRFRTMVDSISQLVWIARPDGYIYWFNQRWYEYTGTTIEQVEGWGWKSVHDEEVLPQVLDKWNKSIKSGEIFEMIFPLKGKNGKFRRFLTRMIPIKNEEGKVLQWFGTNTDVDQLKRSEDALKISEEIARLRAEDIEKLMEIVPAAIWVCHDPECKTITGNRLAEKFYEAKPGENVSAGPASGAEHITTRRFFRDRKELTPDELPMQKAVRTGKEIENSEMEVLLPSGSWITILGSAVPLFNNQGKIRGCISAFMNITSIKNIERQLINSDERLRMALDAGNEGTFDFDLVEKKLFFGINSRKIFGLDKDEPVSFETINKIIHPKDRPAVNHIFNLALSSSKENFDFEYRIILPDSSTRWVHSKGKVYFKKEGEKKKSVRFIGINVDITERKKTEQMLKESREQLRYSFEQYEIALSAANLGTLIYYPYSDELVLDQRSRMIFEFKDTEFVTLEKLLNTVSIEYRESLKENLNKISLCGRQLDFEFKITLYGRTSWVSLKGKCKETQNGLRFSGIVMDVTERRKAEEILKRDMDTLDRLVSERSHKLLETQMELDRSRRLADIGQLAATVAHELRNPLASMHLAIENVNKKTKNFPDVEPNLKTVNKKIFESEQIISNLLFYSRAKIPSLETINLSELINESIETSKTRFPKLNVQLRINTGSINGLEIQADPLQLKEVFANIINNAFDAVTGIKDSKIEVNTYVDKENVKIFITDNGSGISRENIQHLFQPFFSTKAKGTGLGLAISKQIIEAHNGKILLESEINKGTTVSITLPTSGKSNTSRK